MVSELTKGSAALAEPTSSDILAHVLGGFRVVVRGRPLADAAWRRRKARQLFKALLARPQRRLTKDEAVDLFWPDSDPGAASTNLRTAVHAIRQALESVAAPGDLVVADRDGVGLRPDLKVWVDADAFEKLAAEAHQADDPLPLIEQANALYAGDYLPEDLYDDWTVERREALKRAWTELQFARARADEQRGNPDGAAGTLERLLGADACDERAGQELMRLLARQGRRSDAVRVYQRLEQALRAELDLEPSPTTAELHHQIAAGEGERRPVAGQAPTRATAACLYPFPTPSRLVGRQAERKGLERALERGRSSSQVLVLSGPAGAGKSALVGTLLRRAERAGALCLAGAGHEYEGLMPLSAFHEALSGYLLGQRPEHLRTELGAGAPDLAQVVPELRHHLDLPAAQGIAAPSERHRLFGAVHAFLRGLSMRGPVLLCIEDLHAVDGASLQLFGYLARQLAGSSRHLPLVLLGTYRAEEATSQPLSQVMTALTRDRFANLVKLPLLDRAEAIQLASSLLEGPPSEPLTEWLYTTTGGNPLFLEQLVLALREEGRLVRRAGVWHELNDQARVVPTIIRELIGHRFERLSARCRETLAMAAVLGQTVRHATLLAALEPREETNVLEDLAEALDAQLLQEGSGCYVFAHALAREAIYWGLNGPRRMLLHARAGETLERLAGARAADQAAELAHHFTLAGQAAPVRVKALRYSLEAGRRAATLSSHREALDHFAQASDLIEHAGEPAAPAVRLDALEGRGRAEQALARWPASMASFRQVLNLLDDPVRRAAARGAIAYGLLHTGDIHQALAECDAGLTELAAAAGPEVAAARLRLQYLNALVWYLQGRYVELLQLGQAMRGVAATLAQPRSLFAAHSAIAWAHMGQGRVTQALEQYTLALAAAEHTGDKIQLAIAHDNLGFQHYLGGRFAAAREHLDRALALFRLAAGDLRAVNTFQHLCRLWVAEGELNRARGQVEMALQLEVEGRERWAADGYHLVGVITALRAEWDAAEASFEQALGIRQQVGDTAGIVESTVGLGLVHQHVGRWSRAAEAFTGAVRIAATMDPGPQTVVAHRQLGHLRLLTGDHAGAAAELDVALALAEQMTETLEYATTLVAVAGACLDAGDLPRALRLSERSVRCARTVEQEIEAHILLTLLDLATQRQEPATAHAAEAVAQAEHLGSPRLLSLAHLTVGRVARARSNPRKATAAFEAALAQCEVARTPYERALALQAYAQHLDHQGARRDHIGAMQAEARDILRQLGARSSADGDRAASGGLAGGLAASHGGQPA